MKDVHNHVTAPHEVPHLRIMINAVGAVARRMPSAARRSGCWIAWCQAALLGASALVIVAERSARKWAHRPPERAACCWCGLQLIDNQGMSCCVCFVHVRAPLNNTCCCGTTAMLCAGEGLFSIRSRRLVWKCGDTTAWYC